MRITQELYKARYTANFPQSDVREAVEKSKADLFTLQVLNRKQAVYGCTFTREQGPGLALASCLEFARISKAYAHKRDNIALFAIW